MRLQLQPDDDELEHRLISALADERAGKFDRALREWLREVFPPGISDAEVRDWEQRLLTGGATFRDVLERTLIDSTDLGVTVALDQLQGVGIAFDWTLVNTRAREDARQYAGQLITQINETTRANVREAVARWVDNGEPLQALVDDLRRTGFSARRANLIASTEVTGAFARANTAAYQESGVVTHVEWRGAMDEKMCAICGPLATRGERVPLGQRFDGGRHYPPAHPGCRCWVAPVIEPSPI